MGVTVAPTSTHTPEETLCGNGTIEVGEGCDDRAVCTGVGEIRRCFADDQCPAGQTCGTNGFCLCSPPDTGCVPGEACSPDGFCFLPCTGPGQCPSGECRPVGGDGCAANCTLETRRAGAFVPCTPDVNCSPLGSQRCSGACVQSIVLPVPVVLNGTTALVTGEIREETVLGPEGQVVTNAGEVPVAVKAADNVFAPTSVFNTVCACVKPVPNPLFGPGNSGAGVIGCGAEGLTDIDVLIQQDHNTTAGSAGNGGGFPNDPECDDGIFTEGVASFACRERDDAGCAEDRYLHPGICNSPRFITFSGGRAQRGSMLIFNSTSITQLSDAGACRTEPLPGACPFPDYGADCLACTRDDLPEVVVNVTPTTSGKARAAILDLNNMAGAQSFETAGACGGSACRVEAMGEPADCDLLQGNDSLGGVLATAFPGIDSMTLRDTITTTTLAAE
jgi:hypothetical protein